MMEKFQRLSAFVFQNIGMLLFIQIIIMESKSIDSNYPLIKNTSSALSSALGVNSIHHILNNHHHNNVSSSIHNHNMTKGPPIVLQDNLRSITVNARDNVALRCPILSEPPPLYDWFKGKDRIDQTWERFDLSSSHERNIIHIRSVTHDDEGEYTCEAVNGFGKSSFTIRLTVTGEDPFKNNFLKSSVNSRRNGSINNNNSSNGSSTTERPEILKDQLPKEKNVSFLKGSNTTLKCEAKGNPRPNITWFKDNIQMIGTKPDVSTLKLINISENDSGVYKCEAVNYFGKSTFELVITVNVGSWYDGRRKAEIIKLSPYNLTLFPGESGSITCTAKFENEFQPYFFWVKKIESPEETNKNLIYYNNSYFEVLSRTEIKQNSKLLFTTDLILTNVTRADAGSYHCVVTGLMGYAHSEAHVFVHNDPVQLLNIQLSKEKATTIQWAIFSCFLFLIIIILILACIYRLYSCQKQLKPGFILTKSKHPNILPVPYVRSTTSNRLSKSNVVRILEKSPGETTMSTELSHPSTEDNATCQPFVNDLLAISSLSASNEIISNRSKQKSSKHPHSSNLSGSSHNTKVSHKNHFKAIQVDYPDDGGPHEEDTHLTHYNISMNPTYLNAELSESDLSSTPNSIYCNGSNHYNSQYFVSSCTCDSRSQNLNSNEWDSKPDIHSDYNYDVNKDNNDKNGSKDSGLHNYKPKSSRSYNGSISLQQKHTRQSPSSTHGVHLKGSYDDDDEDDAYESTELNSPPKNNSEQSIQYYDKVRTKGKMIKYEEEKRKKKKHARQQQKLQYKFKYQQPPSSPVSFLSDKGNTLNNMC